MSDAFRNTPMPFWPVALLGGGFGFVQGLATVTLGLPHWPSWVSALFLGVAAQAAVITPQEKERENE